MTLKTYQPAPTSVEITRVANGFMLLSPNYARDHGAMNLNETFVFGTLADLFQHLDFINFELTDE